MTGEKTHQQNQRTIKNRVDTSNAGDDFDPSFDLQKSAELRERERESDNLKPLPDITNDDRSILRGVNQESRHNKG